MDEIIRNIIEEKESSQTDDLNITLIIEGSSISNFLKSEDQLYPKVLTTVSSVIFCRSSPR